MSATPLQSDSEGKHGRVFGPGSPAMTVGVVGFLVGATGVATLWVIAFASALAGQPGTGVPFLVSTVTEGADVTITTGPGTVLLPVALGIAGLVAGIGIARKRGFSAGQN
jgi:hypothetical protein